MRKKAILLTLILAAATCAAQKKAVMTYGADFQYYFDNREYDGSGNLFETSGTAHAFRLTPTVGVKVEGRNMTHTLTLGIDVMKNMGESPVGDDDAKLQNTALFREITCWYGLELKKRGGSFNFLAGVFPRSRSVFGTGNPAWSDDPVKTDYVPPLFISDLNQFYDNNLEGLLLKWSSKKGYSEAGLDWMGLIGHGRRERFQIFTYGDYVLGDSPLHAGWTATMYHFANTLEYRGVVDNVLASPFIRIASGRSDFRWNAKLSYVQGLHQDRINETGLEPSFGGLLTLNLGYSRFGILNDSYYGKGQMPYWFTIDGGGNMLGGDLYPGSPFYRVSADGSDWKHPGFYDRAELYWQPYICGFARLRLSAVAHFTDEGFQGWQQKFSVVFSLDRALGGGKAERQRQRENRTERKHFEFYL